MPSIHVRPERPSDYAGIAALHVRAFGQRLDEALIVNLHRQRRSFDPDLSLVAEVEGQPVGHALFNPCQIQLMGQTVRAVNLAPLGVEPAFQKRGVGTALIEAGHQLAREKGFALSFLLGHSEYYPRFGYRPRAFGVASITLKPGDGATSLERREPVESDLDALLALWRLQEAQVDFAIEPELTMCDWLSPHPAIRAVVFERAGEIVGFVRLHKEEPCAPRFFLACDAGTARAMIAGIAGCASVVLPLHPRSSYAAELDGAVETAAWEAAMVCPLNDSPYEDYEREVKQGRRPPGRPLWNTTFDLA
ncbi:MAG: N-acetyltransferase [Chloroflexota bacterium]